MIICHNLVPEGYQEERSSSEASREAEAGGCRLTLLQPLHLLDLIHRLF